MRKSAALVIASVLGCDPGSNPALNTSAGTLGTPVEFSVETWPGEGIPVIESRRNYLFLHEAPDPAAAVIDTIVSDVGSRILFDSTRYQTIEAGSIAVLRATSVMGRDFGERGHLAYEEYYTGGKEVAAVPVSAPSKIEFLQHRAEGTCFVRMNKHVINADPCPIFDSSTVQVEREPATRWWIRVRGRHGTSGWLVVSDSTAQVMRREFEVPEESIAFGSLHRP
jgi:hypothetical protein